MGYAVVGRWKIRVSTFWDRARLERRSSEKQEPNEQVIASDRSPECEGEPTVSRILKFVLVPCLVMTGLLLVPTSEAKAGFGLSIYGAPYGGYGYYPPAYGYAQPYYGGYYAAPAVPYGAYYPSPYYGGYGGYGLGGVGIGLGFGGYGGGYYGGHHHHGHRW
jgi:hypothetical protein